LLDTVTVMFCDCNDNNNNVTNNIEARDASCVLAQIYASDFNRFRMEEVPRHLKDKYRLTTLHEELKVCVKLSTKS